MVRIVGWYPGDSQKKYKVKLSNGKTVQFGNKNYEQFKDKTPLGLYSHKDHLDEKRKSDYRKRHSKILNKNGKPAYREKFSPAWFSWNYLW